MSPDSQILFIEINNFEYNFVCGKIDENNNFQVIHTLSNPLAGINENTIIDSNLVKDILKKNIYEIEQKVNFIFNEVFVIIDNFNCSIINFTGYKKLNGSQLRKDNITYILNSLKSKINEVEDKKTIIHIFNSKYFLDKKKLENLPIGLFGDFYSHELSFLLIDKNNYKNLFKIFNESNLKIKRIIFKNFLDGVNLIESDTDLETFFRVEISEYNTKIIFFEDSSLKYFQDFKFGTNLILKDISKIIALDNEDVRKIIKSLKFPKENLGEDFIEKEFFGNRNYRKIRKKLIHEIAEARIQEIAELSIFKNINLSNFTKKNIKILLKVNDELSFRCFRESFSKAFANKNTSELKFIENFSKKEIFDCAAKLVQYGWKKEAVPVIHEKKTILARLFNLFFE